MDTTFALAKIAASKALAKDSEPFENPPIGPHSIDCTVSIRLKGTLELCPPQTMQCGPSIDLSIVVALLLKGVHGGRVASKARLEKIVAKALEMGGEPAPSLSDRVKDVNECIKQVCDAPPRVERVRSGPTKWSGESHIEAET